MKKIFSMVITCATIIAGAVLIVSLYSMYLDSEISKLYAEKEDALSFVSGSSVKDKGNAWIGATTRNDSLIILGSSELTAPVSQNIKNNFPNTQYGGTTSCIGHATVQNGLHAMDLGANFENFKDSDIVLIESIQWYFGDDIGADGYMSNFSELQFYEFLHNDLISRDNKEYLCNRFLELEKVRTTKMEPDRISELVAGNPILNANGVTSVLAEHGVLQMENTGFDYYQTHLLAKLYVSDNPLEQVLYHLMRPYYYVRYQLMNLKDRYNTYVELKNADASIEKKLFDANWDAQIIQAAHDGKEACTNNDIYVSDDYYTTILEEGWEGRAGSLIGTTALTSKEWEDFQFLLRVCNDLSIKPYIINVSCNAYYYDYAGLDSEMRQEYYQKLSSTAEEYGVPTYNGLVKKEYEPYVFVDVMHLGWKGWIYVSKAITEHFNPKVKNIDIENNPKLLDNSSDFDATLSNIEHKGSRLEITPKASIFSQGENSKIVISQRFPDARYAYLAINEEFIDLNRSTDGFYSALVNDIKIESATEAKIILVGYDGKIEYSDVYLQTMEDILNFESVTGGVTIRNENERAYTMKTYIEGNVFNCASIQLENTSSGDILDPVLIKHAAGGGNATQYAYTHNAPSGEYIIRLRGNSNLSDEYIQYHCYLQEGQTYYCNYSLERFDDTMIDVSGFYFMEPSSINQKGDQL